MNRSKRYKVIELSDKRRLVIVLSYDLTRVQISELAHEIGRLSGVTVYFDFLVSNGLSNRFYSIAASSLNSMVRLRFRQCVSFPLKYEEVSNEFFRKHYRYIEYSVLTSKQRELFKR